MSDGEAIPAVGRRGAGWRHGPAPFLPSAGAEPAGILAPAD
jgi:hypothetical protein